VSTAPDPLAPLPRSFYLRPTIDVARDLLGRYLVLTREGQPTRIARLVETEAYVGEHDLACHASRGKTRRTAPMYEEPGHVYIYFIYGMYWCLNIVTEDIGTPCAVLLRAAEPVAGLDSAANGPGKLCRAFALDGAWNREDLTCGALQVTFGEPVGLKEIATSPRIGVAYAGAWADEPLRYFVAGSESVSHRKLARRAIKEGRS
jgi:DNA-3-methyladenine glycosylase